MRKVNKPIRLSTRAVILLKTVIHLFALAYLVVNFWLANTGALGADPVQALLNISGIAAINFLIATLLISPVAKRFRFGDLMRFRRLLGIYVFVYALAHFATYVVFDLQLNWHLIASEVVKRPYMTVGFSALMILLVLTITSKGIVRRKLGHRWQSIHNLTYLALVFALLHYIWAQKVWLDNALIYCFVGVFLLVLRKDKLIRISRFKKKPVDL